MKKSLSQMTDEAVDGVQTFYAQVNDLRMSAEYRQTWAIIAIAQAVKALACAVRELARK
jgi:hypothetical protein